MIKKYLSKNLFYVSVMITGLLSSFLGIFYTIFKDRIYESKADSFLEGTGVLSSYITESTGKPSETNYFVIILILSLLFFFVITFILSKILNKKYLTIFNLISFLNIILFIGLIIAIIIVNFSFIFTYIVLIITILIYLFILYKSFDLFKISKDKKMISIGLFILLILIILIILKLFV